jgi:hypothetical protein
MDARMSGGLFYFGGNELKKEKENGRRKKEIEATKYVYWRVRSSKGRNGRRTTRRQANPEGVHAGDKL